MVELPLEKAVREMQSNLADIGTLDTSLKIRTKTSKLLRNKRDPSFMIKKKSLYISLKAPTKFIKSSKGRGPSTGGKTKRQYSDKNHDTMSSTQKLDGMAAAFIDLDNDLDTRLAYFNIGREEIEKYMFLDYSDETRQNSHIKKTRRSRKTSALVKQTKDGKLVYLNRHDEESGGVSLGKEVKTHYSEMNEIREGKKSPKAYVNPDEGSVLA